MMPEIINTEVIWEGRFLKSILITYKNGRGEEIPWEAVKRVNCTGIVAIVPFTKDGYVILNRQFRPPVERYVIEFPAGLNDRDESLESVARRELLEETGYYAETLNEIAKGPLSAGASTEVLNVFMAKDVVLNSSQKLDRAEDIEVIRLPVEGFYERLYELQNEDTYIDLKVYGLFELAKKHL